MRFAPWKCPQCGKPAAGTLERLSGRAELIFDEDGAAEYWGETEIDWNSQETVCAADGRVTLECRDLHAWQADMFEDWPAPAHPDERSSTVTHLKPRDVEPYPAVRINVPDWYAREDFRAWLGTAHDQPPTATWHTPGQPVGEYADVFMTYDHGEGSEYPGPGAPGPDEPPAFPRDLWAELCGALGERTCLVWLTNLPDWD